jgi:hypothetical protein
MTSAARAWRVATAIRLTPAIGAQRWLRLTSREREAFSFGFYSSAHGPAGGLHNCLPEPRG